MVIFDLVMLVFGGVMFLSASSTTDSSKSVWVVWVSLLWWNLGVFLQHPNLELKLLYQTLIGNKVAVFSFVSSIHVRRTCLVLGGVTKVPQDLSVVFFSEEFFLFSQTTRLADGRTDFQDLFLLIFILAVLGLAIDRGLNPTRCR